MNAHAPVSWIAGLLTSFLTLATALSACGPAEPTPLSLSTAPALTAEPTLTPAPTATHTAEPTPSDTPTARAAEPTLPVGDGSQLYVVVNVERSDVLNVRAGAGATYPIVGAIPPYGIGVQGVGEGKRANGDLWVPVRYGETSGWVHGSYLARQVGTVDEAIAARAIEAILALRDRNVEALSQLAHPDKGIRFSPYTYVRTEPDSRGSQDVVLKPSEIEELGSDRMIYHWGWFDGTGLPIDLSFEAYVSRFVYDVDFFQPHAVGLNETLGQGNTINNIAQAYPQAVVIEYHFEGFDPAFGGMDWRSLRLVFEEEEDTWYVVGIVHDEWTI